MSQSQQLSAKLIRDNRRHNHSNPITDMSLKPQLAIVSLLHMHLVDEQPKRRRIEKNDLNHGNGVRALAPSLRRRDSFRPSINSRSSFSRRAISWGLSVSCSTFHFASKSSV